MLLLLPGAAAMASQAFAGQPIRSKGAHTALRLQIWARSPQALSAVQQLKPVAVIDYGVFVSRGHFDIPLASALSHMQEAELLLQPLNGGRVYGTWPGLGRNS